MRKILVAAALVAGLGLAGCQTDSVVVTSDKYRVIDIPSSLYNCPVLRNYPDADKLTDVQIARLVNQLVTNNVTCSNSLAAIKSFVTNTKSITEKKKGRS